MPKILYLSHATPRGLRDHPRSGSARLRTRHARFRQRRRANREDIADCEVVIVASKPLRKPLIDAAAGCGSFTTRVWAGRTRRTTTSCARHGIPARAHAGRHDDRRRGAHGAADPRRPQASAVRRLRVARGPLSRQRVAARVARTAGRTIGYVGMGRIARAVVERLRGIRRARPVLRSVSRRSRRRWNASSRRALLARRTLARADVVTLHVPLTPESRHLIGAEQLARMKRGAYLVNTARGGLVDETALACPRHGPARRCGTGRVRTEPLPADHPLTALRTSC